MATNWKGHLKSEFALFQKVMDLIQFHFICADVCKIFWGWIWKDRIKVKKKEEEVFMLCSPAPWSKCVKLGIVQRRLRNVQKSMMHMKSFCFVNINLLLFCRSRCRHCQSCLSSLLLWSQNFATMVVWCHTSPFCYLKYYMMTCLEPFPLGKWT